MAERRTPTSRSGLSRESPLLGYDAQTGVLDLPSEGGQPPPVDLRELRELVPSAERRRELDDWGRSQRVFDLVEPLLDFYYRHWFRVEVEGIENVPASGGALIVSNHSGALPPDAPMIMQAIRHEHPASRPLYMLGENWFKGYPGVGMLANKIGLVGAHPANAQRLLRDEEFRIRFLEPIDLSEYDPEDADDIALVGRLSERIRLRIQEELDDLVLARKSVWFG